MSDQDADNPLRQRLRERISQKAEGQDGSTEQKEMDGDYDDEDDMDDDEDDMESMMEMPPEVEEAAQMVAEAADDVEPAQVMEMLSPLFGEDTTDDPQEMAADVVTEEDLEAKLDEFRDSVDEKLEGVVDSLADETRDVIQKADVGGTPTPSATGDANVSEADLWSDGGEDK